jgi:hypothetical protein
MQSIGLGCAILGAIVMSVDIKIPNFLKSKIHNEDNYKLVTGDIKLMNDTELNRQSKSEMEAKKNH